MSDKKKGLSRAEAAELYSDLQKAMTKMRGGKPIPTAKGPTGPGAASAAKQIAAEIKKALSRDSGAEPAVEMSYATSSTADTGFTSTSNRGAIGAVAFVIALGIMRLTLTALEGMGIVGVKPADASIKPATSVSQPFSKEEVRVLTSLDARRASLGEKSKALEAKEAELNARDREFAVRVSQLKELTDRLKLERDKNDKKRSAQIEQLANVYSSMSPQEAAQLIEQLDVTIALSLIENMPEKKIGQILALMSKDRALMLTKMLSAQ